jgi:hypothetical protein
MPVRLSAAVIAGPAPRARSTCASPDDQRGDPGDQREHGQRDPVRLDDALRLRLADGGHVVESRGRLPQLAVDLALDCRGVPGAVVELQAVPGDAAARPGAQQLPAERWGEQQEALLAVDVVLNDLVVELDQADQPGPQR